MNRSDSQPASGASPRGARARRLPLWVLPVLFARAAAAQDPKPPAAPPPAPAATTQQAATPTSPPASPQANPPATRPSTTTAPAVAATAPAPPAPPVVPAAPPPGPKAVALAFAASLEKGDAAVAKGLVPPTEAHGNWVDAAAALAAALKRLDAAALAKYGDPAGRAVSANQLHLLDNLKALEQTQEKIDGDTATLTLPGQPRPLLHLKQVGARWLLQLPHDPEAIAPQSALLARLAEAADRTAREVATGGHPTAAQATRAFATRALEARLER